MKVELCFVMYFESLSLKRAGRSTNYVQFSQNLICMLGNPLEKWAPD